MFIQKFQRNYRYFSTLTIMSTTILGGGITGLSAAFYLLKKLPNQPITLIESSNRVGGWIKSNVQKNGVVFEQGPRTIRPSGPGTNTLALIEDLGLSQQVLPISTHHPAARNRMIYANGKLHSLPSSFASIFQRLDPFSKPLIRYLINDLTSPKKTVKDEPIYDFVSRRFGQEFADYLISPLVCGICAGNAKEISVNFLMKQFFEYEQNYGNISRGLARNAFKSKKNSDCQSDLYRRAKKEHWNVYTLKNGLETLPRTLHEHIVDKGAKIELEKQCKSLEIGKNNVILQFENGSKSETKRLISAIPSESLANLLENQHPKLAELLRKIQNVTVGVVNLQYNNPHLIPKAGFGFLVPPKENRPILGVIYDSCCFPSGENTVLTVMMGGHFFPKYFGTNATDEVFLTTAKDQLQEILGINEEPVGYKVNVLRKCIPQYVVGHNENLEKINAYLNENKLPISLCGNSYYGVGVNDVILSAKNAVDNLPE